MNVVQPGNETRMPEVERGNEALPPIPTNEHRFEEQPQEHVERSVVSAPEPAPASVVHESPVAAPVPAPSATPVVVHAEAQPVVTEPKNQ